MFLSCYELPGLGDISRRCWRIEVTVFAHRRFGIGVSAPESAYAANVSINISELVYHRCINIGVFISERAVHCMHIGV